VCEKKKKCRRTQKRKGRFSRKGMEKFSDFGWIKPKRGKAPTAEKRLETITKGARKKG